MTAIVVTPRVDPIRMGMLFWEIGDVRFTRLHGYSGIYISKYDWARYTDMAHSLRGVAPNGAHGLWVAKLYEM